MRTLFRLACFAMLMAICTLILSHAIRASTSTDLISYWAAGKQLAHHANPYDGTGAVRWEKAEGLNSDRPFLMRNPPTAFVLAAPLGFLSLRTALIVWTLLLMGALIGSVKLLWLISGSPPDRLHLISYLFAPVLCCLMAGQMGLFLLFSVTLFLYLIERHPFAAGCALVLTTLKPHLFLPFAIVLLLWTISRRKFSLMTGLAVATGANLIFALYFDPKCWIHFAAMMRKGPIQAELIPTLSALFRLAIHPASFWLQFIPIILACCWAAVFYRRNSKTWRWDKEGLLVLTVSLVFAPYGWFSDQVVLLPATLALVYRTSDAGKSLIPFAVVAGAALLEVMFSTPLHSFLYIWPAPALLAWQIYERNARALDSAQPSPTQALETV